MRPDRYSPTTWRCRGVNRQSRSVASQPIWADRARRDNMSIDGFSPRDGRFTRGLPSNSAFAQEPARKPGRPIKDLGRRLQSCRAHPRLPADLRQPPATSMHRASAAATCLLLGLAHPASAADPAACRTVRLDRHRNRVRRLRAFLAPLQGAFRMPPERGPRGERAVPVQQRSRRVAIVWGGRWRVKKAKGSAPGPRQEGRPSWTCQILELRCHQPSHHDHLHAAAPAPCRRRPAFASASAFTPNAPRIHAPG